MNSISSARLTVPGAGYGEIVRPRLIDSILGNEKKAAYIHAGAGYGKTTLLSQAANQSPNPVWLTLAGENEILTFADVICKAIRKVFPCYDFTVSEYLPFASKDNFITILANALIGSVENLNEPVTLILDDLHTLQNVQVKEFLFCFMKYLPDSIRILFGSREAIWQELMPLYLKGELFELRQNELAFTKNEASLVLGVDDDEIYGITEGWPLAVSLFRVLLENGATPTDIPAKGKEALYSYLFYECISRMSPEMIEFLKATACFEELDVPMLDAVLCRKNTRIILESLVSRNMFTSKTGNDKYRYHALFRDGLLETGDRSRQLELQKEAALYYYDHSDFSEAAEYAIVLCNKPLLEKVILASYKKLIRSGDYSQLRLWFQALGDISASGPELLVAKAAFLSGIGNFIETKACLEKAMPLLESGDSELYTEAMLHKARVLRNYVSFEESNQLLDELISRLDDCATETAYAIIIEKLYNLCLNSQINEALKLGLRVIEVCSRTGNLKIKAWFERYMSAVYFFTGNMKKTVYYYERSLELPEDERQYLNMHGIGVYAAKAYQMLGNRERSLSILSEELRWMRSTGKYEEMWTGYLFAAEIYYQNTFIDKINGENTSYAATVKYITLADEYAPLFRKTDFQMHWAKMQTLTYSLIFTNGSREKNIDEIRDEFELSGDYLKSIILARLLGYFAAVSDYENAAECAELCIEVGERAGIYLHSTLAYGVLARIYIAGGDTKKAVHNTERYLKLCHENGIYEYFRARKDYDPVLKFADDNGIEPEITRHFMAFSGYKAKKAYIKTFGSFSILAYRDRKSPLKMRTKKERELLAFLLDVGEQGVTKEQICEAIWSDSESDNIKKLIGTNLYQINKDLASLGIENAVTCNKKRYSICTDEIECDFELFENTAEIFRNSASRTDREKLLGFYDGEYLSDFEAFWAVSKRIKYQNIYEEAVKCRF